MINEEHATAWVTGGRGFLGRHAARVLDANGYEVWGIGRGAWATHDQWGVKGWLKRELDASGLRELASIAGAPSLVFHAAGAGTVSDAQRDGRKAFEDTVGTTQVLADFLSEHGRGAIVVYPSSCAVYGNAVSLPIAEDAAVAPVSAYGEHKAEAERVLTQATDQGGINAGIIRFFSVYGAGLRKQVLWEVASRVAEGERRIQLGGWGDETRDLLHVTDAVMLIRKVAEHASRTGVIVNGGTGYPLSIAQVMQIAQTTLPAAFSVEFTGERRPGNPSHYAASTSLAESLGFTSQVVPSDGITEYCRWIGQTLFANATGAPAARPGTT